MTWHRAVSLREAEERSYRRGVSWWKIKNRDYSQADDGRGELLNGDQRAILHRLRLAHKGVLR